MQPQYSSRILGQKGYELTNHLGNVMAVVSDKVTDDTLGTASSLPAPVSKRAGLAAAYDYYPFGMLMPERSVEDQSIQCIPVSRTRWVSQIINTTDMMEQAGSGGTALTPSEAPAGSVVTPDESGTGEVITSSDPNAMEWAAYIDLPAAIEGQIGLVIGTHAEPSKRHD